MATDNHTAISMGADANAATFNTPLGELDAAIGDISGFVDSDIATIIGYTIASGGGLKNDVVEWHNYAQNANVDGEQLKEWAEGGNYELTSITYHGTYTETVSTATVSWPDGSAGTFTATAIDSTYGGINSFTISHTDSGLTVTQTAVTRDSYGNVTARPLPTVA